MNEQAPKPQSREQAEKAILNPERALPTAEQAEPLRPGEADPARQLEQARAVAERSASDKDPVKQLEKAEKAAQPATPTHVDQELQSISLRRELQSIRRHESAPARALSRLIHQPAVRAVSDAAGKTVSRPSGLLGGGLAALIGSSGYLYLAKHAGFEYNYFVFTALFVGGFAFGLLLELLVWTATRSRRHTGD